MKRVFSKPSLIRILALVLCTGLLLGQMPLQAKAAESGEATLTIEVNFHQQDAREMVGWINDFRLSAPWVWKDGSSTEKVNVKDLKPLVYDARLERAAMQRAAEMAVYFAHYRPNGDYFATVMNDYSGISFPWENGAWGYTSAEDAFEGLCEEDEGYYGQGHRRTMLLNSVNAIGIGHVVYNGIHFWTQEFSYISEDQLTTNLPSISTSLTEVEMPVSEDIISLSSMGSLTAQAPLDLGLDYTPEGVTVRGSSAGAYGMSFSGTLNPQWTSSDETILKSLGNGAFRSQRPGTVTLTGTFGGQTLNRTLTVSNTFAVSKNVTVSAGNTASFKVLKTDGVSSYQWQVSKNNGATWKNINTTSYPSATQRTVSFAGKTTMDGYLYRCKVTLEGGTVCYSKAAKLTVLEAGEITSQPQNTTVGDGETAVFTVTASQAQSYQWQVSKNNGATWKNVSVSSYPSAATKSLSFGAKSAMNGYLYRCRVTFTDGSSAVSETARLSITAFLLQPQDTVVEVGGAASFDAVANAQVDSYRWQVSKDGGTTWKNISIATYPSAKTSHLTFTTKATMDGYLYRCQASLKSGQVLLSDPATLTLITITQQPLDTTAAAGEKVILAAACSGPVDSYRWQVSKDGGATWKNVNATNYPSAETEQLTFTAKATMDGFLYRCVIRIGNGVLISNTARLTVE